MTPAEELVWKLVDQSISPEEFDELQELLEGSSSLRRYYQDCLETKQVLSSIASSKRHRSRVLMDLSKRTLLLSRQHIWTGLAGLLCGVLGTTLVQSAVTSKMESLSRKVIPLLSDPFEDPSETSRQGFPREKGIWSHQRQNSLASGGAIQGEHALKIVAEEGQPLGSAYYLVDLQDFPSLAEFTSRKIQVSGQYCSDAGEPKAHYSIRIAAFAESPKEVGPIWADESELFTRKLSHVGRSCFKDEKNTEWTVLSSEMEIPEGTRTLVIGLGAGSGERNGSLSTHYLDDVSVRLLLHNEESAPSDELF
ncbi:MAG: hypothetical protein AAF733_06255 [Verrucomicrobiota bacterium]